jgi:hypothetical protein
MSMPSREKDYAEIVTRFAADGAIIIRMNPRSRYHTIGRNAMRPLEPGFIPLRAPARVLTVSLYPNESEIETPEFQVARESFRCWGDIGDTESYEAAYRDWLGTLRSIPFHRDWIRPIFEPLGITDEEFAWLPLIKCPLPARSAVPDDDVFLDRMLLWDQLSLLRPSVILTQGLKAAEVVGPMCEGKFPHRMVVQKIARVGTTAHHEAEDERVRSDLKAALRM